MNPRWTPVLTFLAGVLLTVGAYETARLVANTRNALQLASGQLQDEDGAVVEREPARRRAREAPATRPTVAMRKPGGLPPAQPVSGARMQDPRLQANRNTAERRREVMDRLASMTEEERAELRERRQQRRDRAVERLRSRQTALRAEGAEAVESLEDPARDQELIDTGPQ